MKNSTESGIAKSFRRSVSILMVFAAMGITQVAKAADLKSAQANETTNLTFPVADHSDAASLASQPNAEAPRQQMKLNLFSEQRPLYCYTDFGVTRMMTFAVPGDSCFARLNYYPYSIVWGVVGF
jgi:hypothetical protein